MKEKITDLELIKGKIKLLHYRLAESENDLISYLKKLQEIKQEAAELRKYVLREYTKIQIRNILSLIKKLEDTITHFLKIKKKVFRHLAKLEETTVFDMFSDSVETHIVKKLKKEYSVSGKDWRKKKLFFIFRIHRTNFCVFGRVGKILVFREKEKLIEFLQSLPDDVLLFPNTEYVKRLKNSKYYLLFFRPEIALKEYTLAVVTMRKVIGKEKIENFKLYDDTGFSHRYFSRYFFYKGKKVYFFSPSQLPVFPDKFIEFHNKSG